MSVEGVLRAALERALPDEDECRAAYDRCSAIHPIHAAVWTGERVVSIYADVDALVLLLSEALAAAGVLRGAE